MAYGQDNAEMRAHQISKVQFFLITDIMDEDYSVAFLCSLSAYLQEIHMEAKKTYFGP